MGQKLQKRSKTSKIPIKTRDILGPNAIVTLQSLLFPARFSLFITRILNFEPRFKNHTKLGTLLHRLAIF